MKERDLAEQFLRDHVLAARALADAINALGYRRQWVAQELFPGFVNRSHQNFQGES
jgi:hypothetical protein